MRKLGAVVALLAGCPTGACAPAHYWESRPQGPNLPPLPPEHLLRKPPDFRIHDALQQKEYLLYVYEDESTKEEIVAVIDKSLSDDRQEPRLANRAEAERAMKLFFDEWKSKGDDARLGYFNEVHARERRRTATLLDQQILYKKAALKSLEEEKYDLECDLKSRKATNTFAEGSQQFSLASTQTLETRIAQFTAEILVRRVQLKLLEYKRDLRDGVYDPPAPAAK